MQVILSSLESVLETISIYEYIIKMSEVLEPNSMSSTKMSASLITTLFA
jgi:hypothetical protein